MTDERRVDMVRLAKEERYYEREALLGRDTSSVFPSLARQQDDEAGRGGLSVDAIKDALGARKFISETELETLRTTRGLTADDGAVAVDKPLAEILRERKAAKDAEHEEKWRVMKVGKNRPLDPEELNFLDAVAVAEAERERVWGETERAELEAFKAAVRGRSGDPAEATGLGGPEAEAEANPLVMGPPAKADPRVVSTAAGPPPLAAKPVFKALVRVKPKAAAAAAAAAAPAGSGSGSAAKEAPRLASSAPSGPAGTAATEPPSKRAKTADAAAGPGAAMAGGPGRDAGGPGKFGSSGTIGEGEGGGGGGLAGLIGDYGSGDSEGSEA